jgi:hypothetical protein
VLTIVIITSALLYNSLSQLAFVEGRRKESTNNSREALPYFSSFCQKKNVITFLKIQ